MENGAASNSYVLNFHYECQKKKQYRN
jgi:hypothetical protein